MGVRLGNFYESLLKEEGELPVHEIAEKLEVSYNTLKVWIRYFENMNLVASHFEGREKIVSLTQHKTLKIVKSNIDMNRLTEAYEKWCKKFVAKA